MTNPAEVYLPWGTGKVGCRLPKENLAGVFVPGSMPVCKDVAAEAERALRESLGSPDLPEIVHAGDRVAILVDDHTRSTPAAQILPPVLSRLAAGGVRDRDITILITHGTHRLSTDEEVRRKVGPGICERFRVVQHRCTDEANQVYVGLTSRG
ncbi:MAG: lactate racemase domain-containing protein, partial [Anaerolineae bacterium]|nr:lactate racemase domain-containing protein [Anaerolineae bacterium]